MATKICVRCGLERELTSFRKISGKHYRYRVCRFCQDLKWEESKRAQGLNPRRVRSDSRKIGRNPAARAHQLEQEKIQGNKCAICGEKEVTEINGTLISLSLDHCHKTSRYRGLLCRSCNMALGLFKDDQRLLANAIEYLKRWS